MVEKPVGERGANLEVLAYATHRMYLGVSLLLGLFNRQSWDGYTHSYLKSRLDSIPPVPYQLFFAQAALSQRDCLSFQPLHSPLPSSNSPTLLPSLKYMYLFEPRASTLISDNPSFKSGPASQEFCDGGKQGLFVGMVTSTSRG